MEQALWERVKFFKTLDQFVYTESLAAYINNVTRIVKGIFRGKIKGNKGQIRVMKQRLKRLIPDVLKCNGLSLMKKIKLCIKVIM